MGNWAWNPEFAGLCPDNGDLKSDFGRDEAKSLVYAQKMMNLSGKLGVEAGKH